MKRKRSAPDSCTTKRATKKRKVIAFLPRSKTLGEPELHYFDVANSNDISTTAVQVDLNAMAAGDTVITREGNKIQMTAVELRVELNNKVATQNNRCRILIVYDKNSDQASAALATVLEAATVSDFPAKGQKSRFKILVDETITINQSAATPLQKVFWHKFIRVKSSAQLAAFVDGSATQPATGGLSLFTVGDVAAGANAAASLINVRLYFFP